MRRLAAARSSHFNFAKLPSGDVIDESADDHGVGNPGMRVQFFELVPDVFFDILKCVKKGRGNGGCSRAILDASAQILFGGLHQSAIGVVDHHKFFGAQQMMRDDQRAQCIIGNDAAGVSNDVRVTGLQAERPDGKPRVHAG